MGVRATGAVGARGGECARTAGEEATRAAAPALPPPRTRGALNPLRSRGAHPAGATPRRRSRRPGWGVGERCAMAARAVWRPGRRAGMAPPRTRTHAPPLAPRARRRMDRIPDPAAHPQFRAASPQSVWAGRPARKPRSGNSPRGARERGGAPAEDATQPSMPRQPPSQRNQKTVWISRAFGVRQPQVCAPPFSRAHQAHHRHCRLCDGDRARLRRRYGLRCEALWAARVAGSVRAWRGCERSAAGEARARVARC